MPKLSPPPEKIPKKLQQDFELNEFYKKLKGSLRTMFSALGGDSEGVATALDQEGVPSLSIGWESSSTSNMAAPSGYIKISIQGNIKVIPYWDA